MHVQCLASWVYNLLGSKRKKTSKSAAGKLDQLTISQPVLAATTNHHLPGGHVCQPSATHNHPHHPHPHQHRSLPQSPVTLQRDKSTQCSSTTTESDVTSIFSCESCKRYCRALLATSADPLVGGAADHVTCQGVPNNLYQHIQDTSSDITSASCPPTPPIYTKSYSQCNGGGGGYSGSSHVTTQATNFSCQPTTSSQCNNVINHPTIVNSSMGSIHSTPTHQHYPQLPPRMSFPTNPFMTPQHHRKSHPTTFSPHMNVNGHVMGQQRVPHNTPLHQSKRTVSVEGVRQQDCFYPSHVPPLVQHYPSEEFLGYHHAPPTNDPFGLGWENETNILDFDPFHPSATMYTNEANLAHTIWLQQGLLRQALLKQKLNKLKNDLDSSKKIDNQGCGGGEKENSLKSNAEKLDRDVGPGPGSGPTVARIPPSPAKSALVTSGLNSHYFGESGQLITPISPLPEPRSFGSVPPSPCHKSLRTEYTAHHINPNVFNVGNLGYPLSAEFAYGGSAGHLYEAPPKYPPLNDMNAGSENYEEEKYQWKVKIRPDGTRYITRTKCVLVSRGSKNKLLKERAHALYIERMGSGMTTDEETMSELKFGRYWSKEERKKQFERAKQRKKREMILNSIRALKAAQVAHKDHCTPQSGHQPSTTITHKEDDKLPEKESHNGKDCCTPETDKCRKILSVTTV